MERYSQRYPNDFPRSTRFSQPANEHWRNHCRTIKDLPTALKCAEVKEKVQAMMLKVGLLPNLINRYPHEFSGGQCQRIGIARALIISLK